ncbi:helix-turn-helix transcriptional regulator [Paludibacterium paludis]|uniref:Transcriptional regulator n=1 Tax=Paludibacterium paludis TaxID=1225769 RepID=A0A918UBH1_9NEIS|nr:metalloregulator ArsR/SmtB family transcription factor [Paludibacterium paludis]GGY25058.1 transcriptional regulator [Paludibacterium paludis]
MTTAERLLFLLKTRGPESAQILAKILGLTAMGVRKQLLLLEEKGLVASADERRGPGRPTRIWSLSAQGQRRFPDRHADLAVDLLRQLRAEFGEEGVARLVSARERQAECTAREALTGAADVEDKLGRLAAWRHADGYMAHVEREADGSWQLVEHHCPVAAAAGECGRLCESELALFRRLLGEGVEIDRTEHLMAGGRSCRYRVVVKV